MTYRLTLQAAGVYGALAVTAFFYNLPPALVRGEDVLFGAGVSALSGLVAVTLLTPKLLPACFAQPSRLWHLLPVGLGNALLPLVFLVPCLGAVVGLPLEPALKHAAAPVAAAVPAVLLALAGCLGAALCLWPDPATTPRPAAPVVPRRPPMPKLSSEALADLRRSRSAWPPQHARA